MFSSFIVSRKKILWYSFTPIICLCPDVFAEIAYMYHLHNSTVLMLITDLLRRSWALVNLWSDWSLTSAQEKERSDSVSSTKSTFEIDLTSESIQAS